MHTIVEPTGVDTRIDIKIPAAEQNTDNTTEQRMTDLKLLKTRIAESAGKITKAEISSEPTKFIASTIIVAVITAINKLYLFVFNPVACEKVSSKVSAKIL